MASEWDQWLTELRSPQASSRRVAAERFALTPQASRTGCLALVDAVIDEDDEVREWISEALEGMGPPDAKDVPCLVQRLGGENGDRCYWAATLLGRLGPGASAAVPALASTLINHLSLPARERAAWALGEIGPDARTALPPLREAAGSGTPRLAKLARAAIEHIDR